MNVNLDVLELIFTHLHGSDLVSSSLVSRAFLAGVIPSLYADVEYTTKHAKRAQDIMSPFATLAAHNHLVVHVKRIAVHAAPAFQSSNQVSPPFLNDLASALRAATNLRSFTCTVKILPPLLPCLNNKKRLHHMRISASLGSRQVNVLQERTGLQSLSLDFPSWNVIDVLPKWSANMQKTLSHLTIFMSQDIDATVLNTILPQLPRLRGLHLIGCPRVTHNVVLKALSHTPDLRELSFTIFPSQDNSLPLFNYSTPPLTHLSLDIRASHLALKPLITRIVTCLSPRETLAICGGWIGEIKGSSERNSTDGPQANGGGGGAGAGPGANGPGGGGGGPFGPNFHVWHGQIHLHPPGHGHGHGNVNPNPNPNPNPNNPPLLTTPVQHTNQNGNPNPNPNGAAGAGAPPANAPNAPNPNPPLANFLGFPFGIPFGNLNGNNNNPANPPGGGPANPQANPVADPNANPDPNAPSLISSFPPTLTTLHLPQLTPAALKEIVERCEGLQVLGIVMGNGFASPAPVETSTSSRRGRTAGGSTRSGVRPEISVLAGTLSRARALRELVLDTGSSDSSGSTSGGAGGGTDGDGGHARTLGGNRNAGVRVGQLLTPLAVRMLMRESPLLRRIVGEGRIWESPTPTPIRPLPFPQSLTIDLTLSKSRPGPGAGTNHAHGPPGFGTHGGGYTQVETVNDHWFWLTGSASGGKLSGTF